MNARYSKLAFLHRVKERKTPSLSAQASFAPFFPEGGVVWKIPYLGAVSSLWGKKEGWSTSN